MNKKKLSLRARNLDVEPIKVNDKIGNPILIGLVLVWKLRTPYKAMLRLIHKQWLHPLRQRVMQPGQSWQCGGQSYECVRELRHDTE